MPNKTRPDLIVFEWLKKAQDDELNANSILKHRDGTPGCVCFLCQQMAEKLLKAFLVQERKEYPKIHSLLRLVELCGKIDKNFSDDDLKEDIVFLNVFYAPARYPEIYYDFTWQEAEQAMEAANNIKEFILKKLNL